MSNVPAPRARTNDLVVQSVGDELLIYDLLEHKAFCLNEVSAIVWNACNGKNTLTDISKLIGSKDAAELALCDLKKNGLMEPGEAIAPMQRETRREAIRRIALHAAIAVPVIASLAAPTAAQSASCRPVGSACSTSTQCCPGSNNTGCCRDGACANGAGGCA